MDYATVVAELEKLRAENAVLRDELSALKQNGSQVKCIALLSFTPLFTWPLLQVGGIAVAAPQAAAVKVAGGHGSLASAAPALQVGLMEGTAWPQPGEDKFWERAPRSAPAPPLAGSTSSAAPAAKDSDPMHIVHVTAEMAPIAKVRPV